MDDINELQKPEIRKEYIEYKYRWVIVLLMALAFFINGLANNAIIPIASKIAKVYDISETYTNSPVLASFLVYSLMNFPANHIIDQRGLRLSFIIGTFLYAFGLILFTMINKGYYWVLIGAIFVAIGQPFVINCPAKIAAFWFSAANRPLATALMTGSNIIATGCGIALPPLFVDEDSVGQQAKGEIQAIYMKYAICGVVAWFLILVLMRKKPITPPSAGAESQKSSVIESFRMIKSDRNLLKFFGSYIVIYGTFLSFGATSNFLFKPYGYENTTIAFQGICLIVAGVIGSIVFSIYIKRTNKYGFTIRLLTSISILILILITIILNISTSLVGPIILAICIGFTFTPVIPISYDLGCELAFPIGQAQVIGILNGGAMILTFIMTLIISSTIGFGTKTQSLWCLIVYTVLIGLGSLLYGSVQIILKRKLLESQKEGGQKDMIEEDKVQEVEIFNIGEKYKNLNEQG